MSNKNKNLNFVEKLRVLRSRDFRHLGFFGGWTPFSQKGVHHEKGISLFLTLFVMVIILGIVFGISAILISEIKIIRGMGDSVVAFYAADTGIEKVLTQRENPTPLDGYSETLPNNAGYLLSVLSPGEEDCPSDAENFCIKSFGTYKETTRAIEITY